MDALVGRDTELARLRTLVEAATSGTGAAILIEGEPGIGKSALARAATDFATGRGCLVLWAAADELGQALPLRPLLDAFQHLTTPRLAAVRRLLRGEFTGDLDPVAAASEHVLTLVAELCDTTTVVLVVDDLQWADQATIRVWERLARAAERTALLTIGAARPTPVRSELSAIRRVLGESAVLRLDALPDEAVTDLLAGLAGGQPGTSMLRIAADAAGNPLYLTELMDALIRAGSLRVRAGEIEVENGPVPRSLLAAIADRLDFLPRDVRSVLQAAALLGLEVLVADLAIVRNCRVPDLVQSIEQARIAGVLREHDRKLSFRHPLIHAALYDEISFAVRAAWHRDAARALAGAGAPVHRVAGQLRLAGAAPGAGALDDLLLDWLAGAAGTLVAQVPTTAIELLREACHRSSTTMRRVWFAAKLAEALYRSGDPAEAERIAERAMVSVSDPDLLVELHWTIYQSRALVGRSNASLESLRLAMGVPGVSPRQRARLLVITARAHRDLGNVTRARKLAVEALTTAEKVDDTWALAWSLHVMIVVSTMQGNVEAALPLFDRALDVVAEDPSLIDLNLLLQINKAVALGDLDRYDEAVDTAMAVRQLADRTGSVPRLAQAHSALGQLMFHAGRWDDAQREVGVLPDESKDPGATCCDRGVAAVIAFHRDDAASARRHLGKAESSAEHLGNRVVSSLTVARSLDREVVDDLSGALAVLTARLAGTEELDEVEGLLPEAARLAERTGATTVLVEVAARAAELAGRGQVPHRLGSAAYCRGLVDRSPALLLVAADRFVGAGRPLAAAKALEEAALLTADQGDRAAARAAFTRADEIYERLGAAWDVARLRAELRRYGIRRGPRNRHRQAAAGWASLTASEARVARLVADGLANREIAERLVLSVRTVESHVSHILAKLGMRSRVDIVRGGGDGQAGSREDPA
ncbi:ATP-binding protein [Actinophytocola glycyrrhizae]|uniref:ATP-binding protein n=1 Tax=Actinophytocola glycyrrhizae TaxID=2044873 RepID=A0ABV9RVE5_9PSEU